MPVRIPAERESALEPGYTDEHEQIGRYLTTLQKPTDMTTSEFQKFKQGALRFVVRERHLFRRPVRDEPLQRVIDI